MDKKEIIDYLEKRYKHTGDSDLKISIDAINELHNSIIILNKMSEINYEDYCNELKKNKKAVDFIKTISSDYDTLYSSDIDLVIKKLLDILDGDSNEK